MRTTQIALRTHCHSPDQVSVTENYFCGLFPSSKLLEYYDDVLMAQKYLQQVGTRLSFL